MSEGEVIKYSVIEGEEIKYSLIEGEEGVIKYSVIEGQGGSRGTTYYQLCVICNSKRNAEREYIDTA